MSPQAPLSAAEIIELQIFAEEIHEGVFEGGRGTADVLQQKFGLTAAVVMDRAIEVIGRKG